MSKRDEHARVEVTLHLRHYVAHHLEDLSHLAGVEPETIVESLIEQEFTRRAHLQTEECPWVITLAAKRDYLALTGKRESPEALDEARDVLEAAAIDAVRAEREGRRKPTQQDSGALRYRGPSPRRLMLHVMPVDGDLDRVVRANLRPQLVRVRRSGERKR